VTKIVNALSIRVSPRELKSKDTRNLLTLIMQQWLPLSTATFQAIVDIIPPPDIAQAQRLPFMLHPQKAAASAVPLTANNELEKGLYACEQGDESQVVTYVSKMFAIARGDLPGNRRKELTAEEMRQRGREEREKRAAAATASQQVSNGVSLDGIEGLSKLEELKLNDDAKHPSTVSTDDTAPAEDAQVEAESSEVLLAFSRVFSGVVRTGISLIATLPKYDPELGSAHPRNAKYQTKVTVKDLYMMMGKDLVAVDEVPAGHVCAISGFEGRVHRSATLWAPNAAGEEDGQGESGRELVNLAGVVMQVSLSETRHPIELTARSHRQLSGSRWNRRTQVTCRSSSKVL
jgi:ribosome assembly protein 1